MVRYARKRRLKITGRVADDLWAVYEDEIVDLRHSGSEKCAERYLSEALSAFVMRRSG
jgi:hypothetical protein